MQTVSAIFERAAKYMYREFDAKVLLNSTEILDTDIVGFEIEEAICDQEDITLGNFIVSTLRISLRTVVAVAIGDSIKVSIRLANTQPELLEDLWSEWLTMGTFYVDSTPVAKGNVLTVIAFDEGIKCDKYYTTDLSFPNTMANVYAEVITLSGLTADASVVIDPTYTISYYNNTAPMTYREVLAAIAGCHGANAMINRYGELAFIPLNPIAVADEDIGLGDLYSYEETNPLRKVTNLIAYGATENFQSGSDLPGETLYFSNPFITQDILDDIIVGITGLTYMPMKFAWVCFPWCEVGDSLKVEKVAGTTYANTLLLKAKRSFAGGLTEEVEAPGLSPQENEYILDGPITRRLNTFQSGGDPDSVKTTQVYNGVRITTADGLVINQVDINSDPLARVKLSGADFTMDWWDAINSEWVQGLFFDSINKQYVFNGTLSAEVVAALSAIITPNLYAEKATIAEVTVDQLETSDKVERFKNSDTSMLDFIRISGHNIDFIEAQPVDGNPTEQLTDRNGNLLYWTDETELIPTTDVTPYPAIIYQYDEYPKLQIFYEEDMGSGYYIPKMLWGVGSGVGANQKGEIVKTATGFAFNYYKSVTGELVQMHLGEEGISFTPWLNGMQLDQLDIYADGFIVKWEGVTARKYLVDKDVNGRIELITEVLTAKEIPISYNAGNMP